MPEIDEYIGKENLARILLYGPPKSRKTWWAALAAEAGYNVLILAGDRNYNVLRYLTPEAKKRVYLLDWSDDVQRGTYAETLTIFLAMHVPLFWDEGAKTRTFSPKVGDIRLAQQDLNKNWVLVLDTYTALTWSFLFNFALECKKPMQEIQKPGSDTMRESYRYTGVLATNAMQGLKKFPCHLIVVAHQDTYEKRDKENNIILSRIQAKSTSGPHAMQLAKDFTDVFVFKLNGTQTLIDTTPSPDRDGGSTSIPPGIYAWEKLQFSNFAQMAQIAQPDPDLPFAGELLRCSEEDVQAASSPKNNILNGLVKTQAHLSTNAAPSGGTPTPAAKSVADILGKK